MKTTLKITLLLFLSISFSCNDIDLDCLGCQNDTIGLSKKVIQFSSESNSTTITTKGGDWWLSEINLDGKNVDLSHIQKNANQFKVETSDFIFERKNAKEIFIHMNQNLSGKEKKLGVLLTHLNYGAHLNVIQSSN
jgi:hypothetical protein